MFGRLWTRSRIEHILTPNQQESILREVYKSQPFDLRDVFVVPDYTSALNGCGSIER